MEKQQGGNHMTLTGPSRLCPSHCALISLSVDLGRDLFQCSVGLVEDSWDDWQRPWVLSDDLSEVDGR